MLYSLLRVFLCWCSETAEARDLDGYEDVPKKGKKKKKNKKKAAEGPEPEPDSATASSASKWCTFETAGNVALQRLMEPRTKAMKESALKSCIFNSRAYSTVGLLNEPTDALVDLSQICILIMVCDR